MNEFEWRRQLRELRTPVAPSADLWARIETRLPDPAARRRQGPREWLLAASFAGLSLLAIGLAHQRPVTPAALASAELPWKPADPRLAGAAVELDAARMELQQALEQSPRSAALQRLLSRTRQQESRLRLLEGQAG